ncbi:MAG: hypothetical protein HOP14_05900 [Acidobacteria bacterium]|nr:hypothetical protein [Acidobacteriota bacterium]
MHPRLLAVLVVFCLAPPGIAQATEWFVAAGGTGSGTSASPFGRIQDGLAAARPGDTITVGAGLYAESLRTVRSGSASAPIRMQAAGVRGDVVVSVPGRVLRVDHAWVVVEGFVLDGQYGPADTVDVNGGADHLVLRNLEIRRSSRDLVDMAGPADVLIEDCLIHHALNAAGGRTDAHGIAAGPVSDLTIRNTEIHTFSGDGLQVDPGRTAPGWARVTVEGSRIWLGPLPAAENGFPAGTVPGENAIDTKASPALPRATLVVRDTSAWGFRNGLLANMAAFNIKEHVAATLDRVTVFDSEIAFRLRGPGSTAAGAHVTVQNAVVYESATAFRYEDDIELLRVWNTTIGGGVGRPFRAASSNSAGLDVQNLLVLGPRPPEAPHASNLGVSEDAFVDAGAHDYTLSPTSLATDAGVGLPGVTVDRVGTSRPQGRANDVGAYERPATQVGEVVIHAWRAAAVAGDWRLEADTSAAGGAMLRLPDAGRSSGVQALPQDFFDVFVPVESGRPYRLWLRGRAEGDRTSNDSVYVQFSGAVNAKGKPVYRIGTTSAGRIVLEDCPGCGLSGWGWQDTASGIGALGPLLRFDTSGIQTIRIQMREDGLAVDQIVLSPERYLVAPPGAPRDDDTRLPES